MSPAPLRVQRTVPRRLATSGGVGLALAAATVATAVPAAAGENHVVAPGETVSHLAVRYGTSTKAIVQANALDRRATIRVGQRLTIPTGAAAPATATAPAPAPATTYTVVPGDTVSRLAARFGTTVPAVVRANALDARALIRVGQVLSIPSGTAVSAVSVVATAAAPATVTAPATTAATTYTVVQGDTVSRLAARFGTTVAAVVQANGLGARALIQVGQVLSIPSAAAAAVAAPAVATTAAPTTTYTVGSGDTVSALATRFGTTVAAIVQANGLDARAFIRVGQQLTIPGTATSTAATSGLVGSTFAGRTYPAATVASANQNKATLLTVGVPSKADMQALVVRVAREMGVDPALAQAIALQESGFNHASVSPANAIGTMQVIPSSGAWASELVGRELNLLDPTDNVVAGVAILRQLVRSADDLPSAIAGYYQGLSSVRRNGMYNDTRRYVANVQTLMSRFA